MSKVKKQFFILFYIFLILNSMLPNSTNIQKVKKLNTIMPVKLENKSNIKYNYSFKLFEIFDNLIH